MKVQNAARLKHMSWGVALGALVAIVLGFTWGGWVTASSAKEKSDEAVLASRAAICVAQFTIAPDHAAQLAAFKETKSWQRSEFVEKGGWDKMPGEENGRVYVSRACADGIEFLLDK